MKSIDQAEEKSAFTPAQLVACRARQAVPDRLPFIESMARAGKTPQWRGLSKISVD